MMEIDAVAVVVFPGIFLFPACSSSPADPIYNCLDGLCVYAGCRSDQECQDSIGTYPTACR